MVYTEKVRRELDIIMNAFEKFIRKQSYFDILYSEKVGYIRIVVEEPQESVMLIDTPELLLETLLNDVADEFLYGNGTDFPVEDDKLPQIIKKEVRQRMMDVTANITENKAHYMDLAKRCYHDRFEETEPA